MPNFNKTSGLLNAYNYAHNNGMIKSQRDLAVKMGASESTVSKALKGDPKALTKNFCRRFNIECGMIFNMAYLMDSEGEMLANDKQQSIHEQAVISPREFNEVIKKKNEEIIALRAQLELTKEIIRSMQSGNGFSMSFAADEIDQEQTSIQEHHTVNYRQSRKKK